MSLVRIYPDASVALHYTHLKDLDWRTVVGEEEVVLVITSVFMREIDSHKDSSRGRLQKRAKTVSSWLGEVRRARTLELRPGVRLEVNAQEPELAVDFSANGLVPTIGDDRFVACMIRDAQLYPGTRLVCVAADNGLFFKAEGRGFEVIELPESHKLKDEPDAIEIENRELKKQLAELIAKSSPSPSFEFLLSQDPTQTTFEVHRLEALPRSQIVQFLESERQRFSLEAAVLPSALYLHPKAAEIDQYIEELAAWLNWHSADSIARGLTHRFTPVLNNGGAGNGKAIEISLRFPSDVYVAENRKFPTAPLRPKRPEPRSFADATAQMFQPDIFREYGGGMRSVLQESSTFLFERITQGDSPHELRIYLASLSHRSSAALPSFDVWFGDAETISPGRIPVVARLHCGEPPDVREFEFVVRVEVRSGRVTIPSDTGSER